VEYGICDEVIGLEGDHAGAIQAADANKPK